MTPLELSELKSALDLYSSQNAAADKLWAYFSSVTLAVLGFSVASDKVSRSFAEATVVVLGYAVFCVGNFNALILSHRQLIEMAALARSVGEKYKVSMATYHPLTAESVEMYYWGVVVAVCIGILFITWRRTASKG